MLWVGGGESPHNKSTHTENLVQCEKVAIGGGGGSTPDVSTDLLNDKLHDLDCQELLWFSATRRHLNNYLHQPEKVQKLLFHLDVSDVLRRPKEYKKGYKSKPCSLEE